MVSVKIEPRTNAVRETSLSIAAADGYSLGATRFEPTTKRRKLVIINGALGVSHRFYRPFARYLADDGFDVIAYDYRGIAASRTEPLPTMRATITDWGLRDFEAVLRYAIEVLGYLKVHLVAHSVGGQLFGFAQSAHVVDRIVGVGSQLGDYRLWPRPARWRVATRAHLIFPAVVHAFGYLPRGFAGEPLPRGVALEWARWCTTPGYFSSFLTEPERQRFEYHGGRILAYSIEADAFAPKSAVDAWLALFAESRVTRRHLTDPALGHFGFFKSDHGAAHWPEARRFLAQP